MPSRSWSRSKLVASASAAIRSAAELGIMPTSASACASAASASSQPCTSARESSSARISGVPYRSRSTVQPSPTAESVMPPRGRRGRHPRRCRRPSPGAARSTARPPRRARSGAPDPPARPPPVPGCGGWCDGSTTRISAACAPDAGGDAVLVPHPAVLEPVDVPRHRETLVAAAVGDHAPALGQIRDHEQAAARLRDRPSIAPLGGAVEQADGRGSGARRRVGAAGRPARSARTR